MIIFFLTQETRETYSRLRLCPDESYNGVNLIKFIFAFAFAFLNPKCEEEEEEEHIQKGEEKSIRKERERCFDAFKWYNFIYSC